MAFNTHAENDLYLITMIKILKKIILDPDGSRIIWSSSHYQHFLKISFQSFENLSYFVNRQTLNMKSLAEVINLLSQWDSCV